jgi:hypothetical protein
MNKVVTFFRTLLKSSTDARYYRDILAAPTSFSWKYFFVFNLLAAVVTGISIIVPISLLDVPSIIRSTAEIYPADLEIGVDEQGLSINQPLPYTIALPETNSAEVPHNLVVFADQEQITGLADVRELDALMVVTQRDFYFLENESTGEYRAYAIPPFEESWEINRDTVNSFVETLVNNPFIQQRLYLPLLGLLLLFLVYPLTLLMRLVVLTLFSLISWVITLLFFKEKQLSYGTVFQISMHSLTPVIVVAYALGIVGWIFFHGWPYFLAYLIWTLYIISTLPVAESKPSSVVVETSQIEKPKARKATTTRKSSATSRKKKK